MQRNFSFIYLKQRTGNQTIAQGQFKRLKVHHEQREQREQLEAKLRKEPSKKREYENTLKEYIDNGQSLKRSGT
ncbi:hypothetical protein T4C_12632 [Trichinella pseudospiralis]|uniref:Uncharacterized protein n=1 Tax=Trichinella pseudospiralis TaxID=6337 RepID=A0A0V1KAZ5_TRIPS|nr:hypothetical protein T4C_12632 [Trichinella pseudospiralis]